MANRETVGEHEGPPEGELGAEPKPPVDILGIGFGPANLSLAVAVEERNRSLPPEQRIRAEFLEAKEGFGWHDDMLLPETTMQISFLKDLVSMRDPKSPYSFLNYLHDQERLTDFINLKTFFPTRREFRDYLRWVVERLSPNVSYGTIARQIDWNGDNFSVTTGPAACDRDEFSILEAQNVVVGSGLSPTLPVGISPGKRVFHNDNLLSKLSQLPNRSRRRFLVVGAGQSAAEVVAYLHDTYEDADVHASFRRFGYTPSDDTPYANQIFDPASVDEFYMASPETKDRLLKYHWSTNFAAVDAELINEVFRREYDEKLSGKRRLYMHRVTEIDYLKEHEHGVAVELKDLSDRSSLQLEVDAVIFATGFQPTPLRPLLGSTLDVDSAFEHDLPAVDRDYRLRLTAPPDGGIYLNGGVQHSHGITSSLLSNVAVRAAEILDAIGPNMAQVSLDVQQSQTL